MTYNILIPDRSKLPLTIEKGVFGDRARFLLPGASHASEVAEEDWRAADAILLWHEVAIDREIVSLLERCRAIVRIGVGFDNVDLVAAGRAGIYVCNVPDYGTCDVADHATALLLALSRGLFQYDRAAREDRWVWEAGGPLRRLTGATLGIVGLGRIGTAMARRCSAFGMKIVFFDPYKEDGYDKVHAFERCERLVDLLRQVDAVSIHTPLTAETQGMIDQDFFAAFKPDGILINTARGGIMDLAALEQALRSGRLRAAGLDVLPEEPPDPQDPLIAAWKRREPWLDGRLIITPHSAFYNKESYAEIRRKAALEAWRVLSGEAPRNCVNLPDVAPQHSPRRS